MDLQDRINKKRIEEYKKNPTINLADSINRSTFGDLGALTRVSSFVLIIIIGVLFLLTKIL